MEEADLTIRNEGEGRTTYLNGWSSSWIGTDGAQMVEIEGGEEGKITLDIEIGSGSPSTMTLELRSDQ